MQNNLSFQKTTRTRKQKPQQGHKTTQERREKQRQWARTDKRSQAF